MELLGQDLNAKQLTKMSIDALAMHQLLHYIPHNTNDEKMKIASGLSMMGLGYLFGPAVQDKIGALKDANLQDLLENDTAIVVGGAIAGAIAGRIAAKAVGKIAASPKQYDYADTDKPQKTGYRTSSPENFVQHDYAQHVQGVIQKTSLETEVNNELNRQSQAGVSGIISPILVAGSVLWLYHSVIGNGKTPEEKQRQLWGLACGAAGYIAGPHAIKRLQDISITYSQKKEAFSLYNNGGMLLGGILGGSIAYATRDKIRDIAKKSEETNNE